jgi:DNA-binding transcriptional LysR family regulator
MAHSGSLLRQLKTFEITARQLSFTRAADELCITQAAVSHQIKVLEEALEVRLFNRRTRAVELTLEGSELYRTVLDAFARIDRTFVRLSREGGRAEQRLTVSVTPSFSSRWLMRRLDRFLAAHSHLEVRLVHTVAHADLARDGIDLAIRWGNGQWPGLDSEYLFGTSLVPVCSRALVKPDHPLESVADLSHYTLLHEDSYDDWERWFAQAGLPPEQALRGPLIDDSNSLMQAALNGQGIALGRSALIGDDLRQGSLYTPFALSVPAEGAYHMCWRPARAGHEVMALFADFLRQEACGEHAPAAGA